MLSVATLLMCSSRSLRQVQNGMILFTSSIGQALIYVRLCYYSFTVLLTVTRIQIFYAWMQSECKDELTKTFVRLGHMPESIESVDIFNAESLVKDVYFGTILDKTKSLNSLRKGQFVQSISKYLKNQAPSSDSLYMQILRAAHIAGAELLECAQNVLVPGPSLR